jgi:hypothetical protein
MANQRFLEVPPVFRPVPFGEKNGNRLFILSYLRWVPFATMGETDLDNENFGAKKWGLLLDREDPRPSILQF